jgi:hypothetical protein
MREVSGGSTGSSEVVELSVVVPLFNEEENVPALYERLTKVLEQRKERWCSPEDATIYPNYQGTLPAICRRVFIRRPWPK